LNFDSFPTTTQLHAYKSMTDSYSCVPKMKA